MSDVVIDNSAAVHFSLNPQSAQPDDVRYFAPELIDIEFANAMRKLVIRGELEAGRVDGVIRSWAASDLIRCPHALLLPRIWQLRNNITPYDASYVALAEALGIPLATADRRLATAAKKYCEVVLIEG